MTRIRHKKPVRDNNIEALANKVEELVPKESLAFNAYGHGKSVEQRRIVRVRHIPIAWGIPLDETLFAKWFVNFLGLNMMPWDSVTTTTSTYLREARNKIHNDFLVIANNTPCQYFFMLDSDVLPPPDIVSRLLKHKKDMVGGWYHKKSDDEPFPVVYDYNTFDKDAHWYNIRKEPGEGLEKVDAAGAGCWLMSKATILALGESPYTENVGEDMEICRKVHDAGVETWIDWSCACAHVGAGLI